MDIDLALVVEGYALGVPLETLMPKPKPKPKPKKRKPCNGNPMHRRLPGDKVGQFIVVRDTGRTDKKSKSAVYELKCIHCGRIREMDLHYALKLHSCGCLTKQRQAEGGRKPREEEADCRLLREMHQIYCNPEQTLFTNVRRPGKLALYADMSDRDREMLAETLAAQHPDDKPYLDWTKLNAAENILKGRFLEWLDIYQHDQITFPSRDVIVRADRAVECWLRMKSGTSFEDIAEAMGTDAQKVVRTLYAVSLRLQITAFVEAKYGKHALWNCPFTEDKWGTWEQVEASHHCLYDAMVKQGDNRLADYWKKKVDETLDQLERRAKLIGI